VAYVEPRSAQQTGVRAAGVGEGYSVFSFLCRRGIGYLLGDSNMTLIFNMWDYQRAHGRIPKPVWALFLDNGYIQGWSISKAAMLKKKTAEHRLVRICP